MSSPSLRLSPTLILAPLTDSQGKLNYQWQDFFRKLVASQNVVNETFDQTNVFQGPVGQQATLDVRGIPLATLLQHITDAGLLDTTDSIAVDGTGHPLTGGKAAYLALVTSGPAAGQVLQWNGTAWVPVTLAAGGVTQIIAGANITITPVGGTGAVTINAGAGSGLPVNNPTFTGTLTGPHYEGDGTSPTVTPGSGAGVGATASIAGNDTTGEVTLTTGTGIGTLTNLFVINFAATFSKVPRPILFPADGFTAAAAANIFGAAFTDNQHAAFFTNSAGIAGGTYNWTYQVMA
jgi:hypothetical protein